MREKQEHRQTAWLVIGLAGIGSVFHLVAYAVGGDLLWTSLTLACLIAANAALIGFGFHGSHRRLANVSFAITAVALIVLIRLQLAGW